ncbi:MAG: protein-glutamate methylesterase/protein-glutamine glutaminase [Halothiobacillus sp.]
MVIGVLIVDDSVFFRRALRELIATDDRLTIVGEAANGREAILKACQLKPDVITMDVEMPIMDGIAAVREIMNRCPTPIMMLSSLTQAGAVATFEALDAGAVDFYAKNSTDPAEVLSHSAKMLTTRLRLLATRKQRQALNSESQTRGAANPSQSPPVQVPPERGVISRRGMVAIGSSTGGPAALQRVLQDIPADFPVPIVIAQHMPAAFTGPFANRLNESLPLHIVEVTDGCALVAGTAYIIPGGKHGEIKTRSGGLFFAEREPISGEHFRPSVNILLHSAANAVGIDLLGVILTGMGDDGTEGARTVRSTGGHIWAQDQASSVIYGMPAAVAKAGLVEAVLPLNDIGEAIARCVR